jgi:hypothetical protein
MTDSVKVQVGYGVAGLAIGALWLAHSGESPLLHALRLLGLMAIVMAASTLVRRWASMSGRRVPHHRIGRFVALKIGLLCVAVAVGIALESVVSDADVWIAVGMAALVAVAGPRLHPWLTERPDVPALSGSTRGGDL